MWNKLGTASWGSYINSPNIGSVISEVVSRPGWASGNSLAIIHYEAANATNEWEAVTYEGCGGSSCVAVLEITYRS